MSEEQTERPQPLEQRAEKKALGTPDAQAARNASAADVNEAQSANPNKFESMTQLPTIKDGMSLEAAQAEFQSFGINMGNDAAVTAKGIEEPQPKRKASIDPRPSYVEGLKAFGNDEETQGKYSIEYMERKGKEALAALQKPPAEQVLITSNVTRAAPNLEKMKEFEDVHSDSDMPKIAQNYQDVRQAGLHTDAVRMMAPGVADRAIFPYRGLEDQHLAECTKANPQAWNQAFGNYPNLRQFLSDIDGPRLMQALVRNELHHYDPGDIASDKQARNGKANDAETLGYAQITPIGLRSLEQKYPQLKAFIEAKGYLGPAHAGKVLEDPSCVPMIVGAKIQSIADHYQSSHDKVTGAASISINARTLAYGYNADVYYNSKNLSNPDFHASVLPKAKELEHLRGYDKAFPTSDERVLSKSAHVQNVESQLKTLR